MQLPASFLESLEGIKGFSREAFEKVHSIAERITSIRINPLKPIAQLADQQINQLTNIPWALEGYYLDQRPSFTFDPLFHAGCYYVQEASSMFLEQALKQTVDVSKSVKVLDLCAAPGGKSTHIQSLITKESLLVSNEVIRSRANILKDNIIKWGSENVVVTNNDPKDFAGLENYFDVIVVDAPCSGSGLFRRDADAIHEWSENNVQLCSQRQQRILADVWPALKKDGILIYSTCSYSKEEDEDIMAWITQNFSVVPCPLSVDTGWGIIESGGGYRFWPDKIKGEGFFLACFQKKEGEELSFYKKRPAPEPASKKETVLIEKWVSRKDHSFFKHENTVYTWPEIHVPDFSFLMHHLRVIYSGTLTGELVRDKLLPAHALAMSGLVTDSLTRTPVDLEQSVKYLQRRDLDITPKHKGWQLLTYKEHSIGWINALETRINNYYPKTMRIIKDI